MGKKIIEMKKLRKISSRTLDSIRKETSKYIFVHDKEGNAYCECCQTEVKLPKTKHLQKGIICPNCNTSLSALHEWRRCKNCNDRVDWRIISNVMDDGKLVLRYILVYRLDEEVRQLEEVAREVIDFQQKKNWYFERRYVNGEIIYKQGTYNFFREYGMGYNYRRFCCLQGEIHSQKRFVHELRKLPEFKYFDPTKILERSRFYISATIVYGGSNSLLYELLQKAGYENLVISDINGNNNSSITFNSTEKSLSKKIGLTDRSFKILKRNQNIDFYNMLRRYPNMTDKEIEFWLSKGWGEREAVEYHANNLKLKQAKYIACQGLSFREYVHYIRTCEELKYPMTDYYVYPKDFRHMDEIISNEYIAYKDKIKAEQRAKHSELIHQISEGLRNLPEIKKLMGGSNGLLVYVPDNADDLTNEGKALHNCIGTYIERVAMQKTLIFYIRQLNNPNTPFVAMEVGYDGTIHQVRYDHNVAVKDNNIIDFAKAVAQIVKKNQEKLIKKAA